ncbi:MAG: nucleotidyl transferase AbiEii/AbiGii toxin family protein, partial [Sediminibacterium sp.]|nr:nucleotidyl transferase AbiEii/AbiGii toxin family protein [Sediminibacterium sp.]
MLHVETVEPATFSLLSQLMQLPALKDFYLVGGTALSLLYGHRKSDDLDLFSYESFINEEIVEALKKQFQQRIDNRTSTPR